MMIDCGEYTTAIREYVENQFGKQIDLLIITHIDADHIHGIEQMLKETPDLNIGKIIFNSYERQQGQPETPLTPIQKQQIESIKGEL